MIVGYARVSTDGVLRRLRNRAPAVFVDGLNAGRSKVRHLGLALAAGLAQVRRLMISDLTAPSRSACRQRIDPRIERPCAHLFVIAHIACDDGQAMMERRCCDDQIGLRERVAGLAAIFHQEPPLEHDFFRNQQNTLLEHRSYLVREPVIEFGSFGRIGHDLDPKPYFGESYHADVK